MREYIFGATIIQTERSPSFLDQLVAQVVEMDRQKNTIKEKKSNVNQIFTKAAENLRVDCRDTFPQIPSSVHRDHKRAVESQRNVHTLFKQTYTGLIQICNVWNNDPMGLSNFLKEKMKGFTRSSPQVLPEALINMGEGLYPSIRVDRTRSLEDVYTALAGLGLMRVTLVEDYQTSDLVQNAIKYVLKVPLTEQLLKDHQEIFDGSFAVRDDILLWNHVQNGSEFLKESDYY